MIHHPHSELPPLRPYSKHNLTRAKENALPIESLQPPAGSAFDSQTPQGYYCRRLQTNNLYMRRRLCSPSVRVVIPFQRAKRCSLLSCDRPPHCSASHLTIPLDSCSRCFYACFLNGTVRCLVLMSDARIKPITYTPQLVCRKV